MSRAEWSVRSVLPRKRFALAEPGCGAVSGLWRLWELCPWHWPRVSWGHCSLTCAQAQLSAGHWNASPHLLPAGPVLQRSHLQLPQNSWSRGVRAVGTWSCALIQPQINLLSSGDNTDSCCSPLPFYAVLDGSFHLQTPSEPCWGHPAEAHPMCRAGPGDTLGPWPQHCVIFTTHILGYHQNIFATSLSFYLLDDTSPQLFCKPLEDTVCT